MLTEIILSIHRKEYLMQALKRQGKICLPANTFIKKTLPGLGATYCELVSERDSIIIEPNVPVILSKAKKHKGVLAIVRGVQPDQIAEYIETTPVGKRKLLTTPESFHKIAEALKDSDIDLYDSFFVLFDECEKLIQDIHFRSSIEDPINAFFQFQHKAFVSATPILPADKRLEEQGFRILNIRPDYEYRRKIKLITTNNLSESLYHEMEMYDDDIYIFCNSVDTFLSLAHENYKLREAVYFCSEDSTEKLKELRIKEYRTEFQKPGKINVLTSRFFSAVDIELRRQPHVILLTDLYGAPQSVIDPDTEAVQIVGRFRNGVKSITHISAINPELDYKDENRIHEWLKGAGELFEQWQRDYKRTANPGRHELLLEAIENSSYKQYLYTNNTLNPFLVKNFYEQERVKSLYTSASNLYEAYRGGDFFDVTHQPEEYPLSDNDRLNRQRYFTRKISCKILLSQLERIDHLRFSADEKQRAYHNKLIARMVRNETEQLLYNCFIEQGADFIREADYSSHIMEKAVKDETTRQIKSNPVMVNKVKKQFETGKEYLQQDALIKLAAIYKRNGINKRVTLNDLKLYFNVSAKRIKNERKIVLNEK